MNPGPIVCFGNSLTEGYLVPRGFSYPAILRELTGRPVVNLGISGDTTGDGLRRLAEPISYELGIAIVEFGINDFLLGISLVTAARNLSSIIEGLKQGGAEVVLMGFHL
ncbi:MAG TPA: arylesterase, partial [Thermodesulfobacteriaceae bacterium]|nr:arylesterase [Thermodesulfobacteriaceae bacterium]